MCIACGLHCLGVGDYLSLVLKRPVSLAGKFLQGEPWYGSFVQAVRDHVANVRHTEFL